MVWRRPNADEEHGDGPDIIGRWAAGLLTQGCQRGRPPPLVCDSDPLLLNVYTISPGSYLPWLSARGLPRRVKVDGVGVGVVIAFKKKKYGASPHTIRLEDSGDEQGC